MGSYNLTYPHVTSYTSAFGRMATPARVRSPIHIDPRREYAQVLRLRGTPGSALAAKVGELVQGIIVVSPVGRMKDTREAPMGTLGGTSVGSMLATYETLGTLPF